MRVVEQLLGKRRGAATDILFAVRGIGENQIEFPAGGRQLLQSGEGVLHPNFQPSGIQSHLRGVWSQNLGVAIGLLDAYDKRRGAAPTLQTAGPRAGE